MVVKMIQIDPIILSVAISFILGIIAGLSLGLKKWIVLAGTIATLITIIIVFAIPLINLTINPIQSNFENQTQQLVTNVEYYTPYYILGAIATYLSGLAIAWLIQNKFIGKKTIEIKQLKTPKEIEDKIKKI